MIARKLNLYLAGIAAIKNSLSIKDWGVRIRKDSIPQGMPVPYVRTAEIGGHPDYHLLGELADLQTMVQVDVWAETEKQAEDIAELIRLAPLSGYSGTWSDADGSNPTPVKAVTIQDERPTAEDPKDGSDAMRYRNTKTYRISYERPVS